AQAPLCEGPDPHGPSAVAADRDLADLRDVEDLPGRANEILLARVLDVARPDVLVVAGECREDVAEGEPVGDESLRIGSDVELLLVAADGVDVGGARDGAELRADGPVRHRAQVQGGGRG